MTGERDSPWPAMQVRGKLGAARGEWLHTNGAGAYASSTIASMHTRRYHGLLVAALEPPGARHVFLSHVDVTVALASAANGERAIPSPRPGGPRHGGSVDAQPGRWDLAKHQFPGVDPEGTPFHLDRFDQDPLPRWTHHVAGGELEVTLGLVRGENAVVLRYSFRGPEPITITLRPLLAVRHYHQLSKEHGGMLQRVELRRCEDGASNGGDEGAPPAGEMRVQPRRDLPRVCFRYEGTFVGSPDWWRRFEYLTERDRGLPFQEDLWTPGIFEMQLDGSPGYLVAAVERLPSGSPAGLLESARASLLAEDPGPSSSRVVRKLTVAAEAFRADLAPRPSVLAGYPWYEVCARDALIALPGLYLVPGKTEAALGVLSALAATAVDGLVPDARGGNADASLWLFEAARHVADALGDRHPAVVADVLPALARAFEAIVAGDALRVTADGLVAAGAAGETNTWMDARVDGAAVTSRAGCPVELNALWSSGCETLAELAEAGGDLALSARARVASMRAREAFGRRFWCAATSYPYDVVPVDASGEGDPAVRPNALLALAIDPACFTDAQADAILQRARADLLTPAGVRTLAPSEPGYLGRYVGGVAERDRACHQGTAWPWLTGAYVRAAARRGVDREELTRIVERAAESALALGHIAELADGDAPHAPRGAIAHAAAVAELLRALVWELGPSTS